MVGVDLFAGAGGLSLGATQAGVDVRLAIEADEHAALTWAANHDGAEVFREDIRDVLEIPVCSRRGDRVLFGGPPCQGFSTSNRRTRSADNANNWLYQEFLRLARIWNPEWVLLENVRGLVDTEDGLFLQAILDSFRELGYTTTWWVLNAANYGVAQVRQRLFIVGSLAGIAVPPPPRSHSPSRWVTVRNALRDLPSLENGASDSSLPYRQRPQSQYATMLRAGMQECDNHLVTRSSKLVLRRYKNVPQGGNWECIPSRLMRNYADRRRCHTGIYHRLRDDKPSTVIGNFRKNMLIHPWEDRGLSVREAARLQSFPDSFVFKGSIGFQQQQVGNAVPPLLAQAVFDAILTAADECNREVQANVVEV